MTKLSASRLKTLTNCGLLFWFQYVLKVPQGPNNSGAARGSTCHYVLECLLRKDRRKKVETILKFDDPWVIPSIFRLAKIHADKLLVGDEENFEMIRKFILVALKTDFYCDGALDVHAEEEFNIKTDKYWIGGFLDKRGVFSDKVKIIDYKSSKAKFTGKDHTFNLQNYFYTLAEKKRQEKEGQNLPIEMEFHFLKFPKAPIQQAPKITDDELKGFEEWLGEVSEFIDHMTLDQAVAMAAKNSIETRWLCGRGLDDMNKAGTSPAFVCQYKMPGIFFALVEGDKIVKSSRDKSELDKIKEDGQEIVQKYHLGCPLWKHLWKNPT